MMAGRFLISGRMDDMNDMARIVFGSSESVHDSSVGIG
jgi:hypothetical protein